jgi:hypothetical protein
MRRSRSTNLSAAVDCSSTCSATPARSRRGSRGPARWWYFNTVMLAENRRRVHIRPSHRWPHPLRWYHTQVRPQRGRSRNSRSRFPARRAARCLSVVHHLIQGRTRSYPLKWCAKSTIAVDSEALESGRVSGKVSVGSRCGRQYCNRGCFTPCSDTSGCPAPRCCANTPMAKDIETRCRITEERRTFKAPAHREVQSSSTWRGSKLQHTERFKAPAHREVENDTRIR